MDGMARDQCSVLVHISNRTLVHEYARVDGQLALFHYLMVVILREAVHK